MYSFQGGALTLNETPLKLMEHFIYIGSNISSTKSNIRIRIGKVETAIDRVMTI